MSDDVPDISNAPYPADFNVPPGMPVPTAEDIAAASHGHAGIGSSTGSSTSSVLPDWWPWALGGVVIGSALLYLGFRAGSSGPAPLDRVLGSADLDARSALP